MVISEWFRKPKSTLQNQNCTLKTKPDLCHKKTMDITIILFPDFTIMLRNVNFFFLRNYTVNAMRTQKHLHFIYSTHVQCAAKQLLMSCYFLWFDGCYNQLFFHSSENTGTGKHCVS